MPTLTRWFVKASLVSLVYMLLGFTFGALMLTNKGIPFAPMVWDGLPNWPWV